jgi:hypothetical protein
MRNIRKPSPSMVVALSALFIALSGTAVAAGVVPLAKRALTADNAKHAAVSDNAKRVGAQTADQIISRAAQAPGPASTAAGLVTIKTGAWFANPGSAVDSIVPCAAGEKAIGGGWEDPNGYGHPWDSGPMLDGSAWHVYTTVASNAPAQQSGKVYAVCIK